MNLYKHPPLYLSWIIWLLGASFYFVSFYNRVALAAMTEQLMADFHIGAAALGNLSAFYFYSYFAMQLPTGILVDRVGFRRLLTAGSFIAALGMLVFGFSTNIYLACIGRLIIGGSVAVAFIAILKLSLFWFAPQHFAMLSAILFFIGLIGGIAAGVPLKILVTIFGWRTVMIVSGGITMVISVVIWMVVRDDPREKGYLGYFSQATEMTHDSPTQILNGLRTLLHCRNVWLLSIAASGLAGPMMAFCGLWGVPFLSTHYGLPEVKSVGIISTVLISWSLGGPLLSAASDRIGYRKPVYFAGCLVALSSWMLAIYLPDIPIWILIAFLLIGAFASGVVIITFAFVKESVPPALIGTASGICNMGILSGPMILQPLIGWVLDRNWDGTTLNGARTYDLDAYKLGFAFMCGWSVLAAILIFFAKETKCCEWHKAQTDN